MSWCHCTKMALALRDCTRTDGGSGTTNQKQLHFNTAVYLTMSMYSHHLHVLLISNTCTVDTSTVDMSIVNTHTTDASTVDTSRFELCTVDTITLSHEHS